MRRNSAFSTLLFAGFLTIGLTGCAKDDDGHTDSGHVHTGDTEADTDTDTDSDTDTDTIGG